MKTRFLKNTTLLVFLLMSVFTFAQPGAASQDNRNDEFNDNEQNSRLIERLNLNDEQKEKVNNLRFEHQNEVMPLRNQRNELVSQLTTQSTLKEANLEVINKIIDQISTIENQLMKANEKHRQEIRAILTPEQRLQFDMEYQNRFNQKGKKQGAGQRQGNSGGQGQRTN